MVVVHLNKIKIPQWNRPPMTHLSKQKIINLYSLLTRKPLNRQLCLYPSLPPLRVTGLLFLSIEYYEVLGTWQKAPPLNPLSWCLKEKGPMLLHNNVANVSCLHTVGLHWEHGEINTRTHRVSCAHSQLHSTYSHTHATAVRHITQPLSVSPLLNKL